MIDLSLIFSNTLAGIITQLPTYILIIWAVKTVVREMPNWLESYFRLSRQKRNIEWARGVNHGN